VKRRNLLPELKNQARKLQLNSSPQIIDLLKECIKETMPFLFRSAADQGGFFGEITKGGFNLVTKQ